jgi:tetratricopeptide (TPR) repeat protein
MSVINQHHRPRMERGSHMSDWRLDEHGGAEAEVIGEIDVIPGHPDVISRIERLQREVEYHPHDWQTRVALAQALAQNGQFDQSVGQLRSSLDLVSDRRSLASIFFNLGVCFESQEAWAPAISAYEQCAFLLPHLFWVHHNLGICFHRSGNLPCAVDEFRLATALNSELPELYRSLAEACLDAGLAEEARQACRRCIDLEPHSVWPHQALDRIRRLIN